MKKTILPLLLAGSFITSHFGEETNRQTSDPVYKYSDSLQMHWYVDEDSRKIEMQRLYKNLDTLHKTLNAHGGTVSNYAFYPEYLSVKAIKKEINLAGFLQNNLMSQTITLYEPVDTKKLPVLIISDPVLGTYYDVGIDKDQKNDKLNLQTTEHRDFLGRIKHTVNSELYYRIPKEDAEGLAIQLVHSANVAINVLTTQKSYRIAKQIWKTVKPTIRNGSATYTASIDAHTTALFTDAKPIGVLDANDSLEIRYTADNGKSFVLSDSDFMGLKTPIDDIISLANTPDPLEEEFRAHAQAAISKSIDAYLGE